MSDPKKTERWLRQWLDPILPMKYIRIMGHIYAMMFHFRIAFYVHCVFYDIMTKEYLWYVIENQALYEEAIHQSKRYPSYDTMIADVAQHFTCDSISPKSP